MHQFAWGKYMNMLKNRKEYAKTYVAWKLKNAAERN